MKVKRNTFRLMNAYRITDRPKDIHGVTNCAYDIISSVRFSSIAKFSSFRLSRCIQQSIGNSRLDMWRTERSVEWVQCHFREGLFVGEWPWPSTNLNNEDKERVQLNSLGHHELF